MIQNKKIKREIPSEYQLNADLYSIPIGNVKKLVPNLFNKEKHVIHSKNLQFYLRLGLNLEKVRHILGFTPSQWLKPYIELKTQKRIEAEKNNDKNGKALYKLMNNAIKGKTKESKRNEISEQLVKNKKDYLKCTSKPSFMTHKIFDNNLVAKRKRKLAVKLNKPAYIGMFILELSKLLM